MSAKSLVSGHDRAAGEEGIKALRFRVTQVKGIEPEKLTVVGHSSSSCAASSELAFPEMPPPRLT